MMNLRDFGFIHSSKKSPAVDTTGRVAPNGGNRFQAPLPAPDSRRLTIDDGGRFLRVVERAAQIHCHRELLQLLQGEEIQYFLPHQVLISAWGGFGGPHLQLDVFSAVPGLRTDPLTRCSMGGLLLNLYKRWVVHGRQPLLLDSTMEPGLMHTTCDCALHKYLRGAWSLLLHGVIDVRDGNVSLYLVLNAGAIASGHGLERCQLMVDPLITQIDAACRRIGPLNVPHLTADQGPPAGRQMLSPREEQILLLVSAGRTNDGIGNMLHISLSTVKNHLHRILNKLGAANRTEAVAHYRQMDAKPKNKRATSKTAPDRSRPLHA